MVRGQLVQVLLARRINFKAQQEKWGIALREPIKLLDIVLVFSRSNQPSVGLVRETKSLEHESFLILAKS